MTATTKQGLAQLILGLTFSELKAVATDLHGMCADETTGADGRPYAVRGVPVDVQDFVDLLHDWAEAQ